MTVAVAAGALAAAAGPAHACGGSGPGGTGMCEFPQRDRARPARVGASVALTDTTILFGEGRRASMTRAAAFASLALPVSPRVTFEGALGGLVSGELGTPARAVGLGPGIVTALGVTWRALDGRDALPLVVVGLTLSGTFAKGDVPGRDLEAYDLRATALVGKTIADVFTPYALVRGFGGPVFFRWDDGTRAQGTDLYKYQVGGGASLALGRAYVFAEGAPLGERNVAAGVGVSL